MPPIGPFFDPATDGFGNLLGDQSPSYGDLTGLLSDLSNQLQSHTPLITDAATGIADIFLGIDDTFRHIWQSTDGIDYEQEIAAVIAAEADFYNSVDAIDTDTSVGEGQIVSILATVFNLLLNWIVGDIEQLLNLISSISGIVNSIPFFPVPVGGLGGGVPL